MHDEYGKCPYCVENTLKWTVWTASGTSSGKQQGLIMGMPGKQANYIIKCTNCDRLISAA